MQKRLIGFILAITTLSSLSFISCGDKNNKHKVSPEEYNDAFTTKVLSNFTVYITWDHNDNKEYYYYDGENFAFCRYHDDVQYYGKLYKIENGKESYYLYGSEYFEQFSEEDAFWSKSEIALDENSFFRQADFVSLYKRDFHLLSYNEKTNKYAFDFVAQDFTGTYLYQFENKRLKTFEIVNTQSDYHSVWKFYNYGNTQLPVIQERESPAE